ncbi:hypothetical protein J6590_027526 [Homalodisca vitripennis]|nr:hypothetical protein J6590_027526 [Homalodisca vitripennis]
MHQGDQASFSPPHRIPTYPLRPHSSPPKLISRQRHTGFMFYSNPFSTSQIGTISKIRCLRFSS